MGEGHQLSLIKYQHHGRPSFGAGSIVIGPMNYVLLRAKKNLECFTSSF